MKNKIIIFTSIYFLFSCSLTTANAIDDNSLSHILFYTSTGVDLIFNLIGGLIGGIVYIIMRYTDQTSKFKLKFKESLGYLFISTVGGLFVFLLTESKGVFRIEDNVLQLAIVILFGATSSEGWMVVRDKFLKKIQNINEENKK